MSEELLRAARNGDEEAFAALYQKYFPLLLRLKNTYYLRNYVSEDWEQEARIALYQALRTYEKSKRNENRRHTCGRSRWQSKNQSEYSECSGSRVQRSP
mgnify:CR=1 FL=1